MDIINTDLASFIDKYKDVYSNTLGGYNNLDVFGNTTDLNGMANRAMNNTTNNNSSDNSTVVQIENNFNITNNKQVEANLMPNDIAKVLNKQLENYSNHR